MVTVKVVAVLWTPRKLVTVSVRLYTPLETFTKPALGSVNDDELAEFEVLAALIKTLLLVVPKLHMKPTSGRPEGSVLVAPLKTKSGSAVVALGQAEVTVEKPPMMAVGATHDTQVNRVTLPAKETVPE